MKQKKTQLRQYREHFIQEVDAINLDWVKSGELYDEKRCLARIEELKRILSEKKDEEMSEANKEQQDTLTQIQLAKERVDQEQVEVDRLRSECENLSKLIADLDKGPETMGVQFANNVPSDIIQEYQTLYPQIQPVLTSSEELYQLQELFNELSEKSNELNDKLRKMNCTVCGNELGLAESAEMVDG
jgi:chromosome segregation ATPase